jgi:hypothetical protein
MELSKNKILRFSKHRIKSRNSFLEFDKPQLQQKSSDKNCFAVKFEISEIRNVGPSILLNCAT